MTFTLKDIPNAVVQKKLSEPHQGMGRPDGWNNFRREGFNQGTEAQASVRLRFKREDVAGKCYELRCRINGGKGFVGWNVIVKDKSHPMYFVCLEDADTILSAGPTLIEVEGKI